jgi:hypothetical protein
MDDQQSDKSSDQEDIEKLKLHIKDLGDLLKKFYRKAQEKTNLSEIERSITSIDSYCYKPSNKPILCEYNIKTHLYSKDEVIMCYSDMLYLPSEIKCTKYNKSFELFDPLQTISFLESIKEKFLDIFDIAFPEVPKNLDNQYITINVDVYTDSKESIKVNPEISKHKIDKNSFKIEYYDGIYYIKIIEIIR